MKTIQYLLLLLVIAVSFSSCVVHERVVERRSYYVPGHYEYGPYQSRHWVRGYYR